MCSLALVLSALFVPETYYNRDINNGPSNGPRILTLIGVHQRRVNLLKPNTLVDALFRPVKVITKLPILLISFYYFLTFAWVVGINSMYQSFFLMSWDLQISSDALDLPDSAVRFWTEANWVSPSLPGLVRSINHRSD